MTDWTAEQAKSKPADLIHAEARLTYWRAEVERLRKKTQEKPGLFRRVPKTITFHVCDDALKVWANGTLAAAIDRHHFPRIVAKMADVICRENP